MKKTNKRSNAFSRRKFLANASAVAAGTFMAPKLVLGAPAYIRNYGKPNSLIKGVQIGVITYSYRSMENDAESILKYCIESGISAIELMGYTAEAFAGVPQSKLSRRAPYGRIPKADRTASQQKERDEWQKAKAAENKKLAMWRANTPMDKFIQLRKMYNDAGVSIFAWKPSALRVHNTDDEIKYALKVAKILGASHVTVELPGDDVQSKRLGKLAKKHKVKVGYHGHLQQTFTSWDTAIAQSKYNALNCDIGHYTAAGFDPIPLLKAKHDKIESIHLKDRQSKANGQKNMPWGGGDTPLVEALQLMRDQKYTFPATVELEYKIPDGSDAVKEVQRCLEFCRKALNG